LGFISITFGKAIIKNEFNQEFVMKNILKLEELAMFSLSVWALYFFNRNGGIIRWYY